MSIPLIGQTNSCEFDMQKCDKISDYVFDIINVDYNYIHRVITELDLSKKTELGINCPI